MAGRVILADQNAGAIRTDVSVAPNITTHEDGLAGYSDEDLARMITEGIRPDGNPMLPPMGYGYYADMTADDLAAIILYLRQIPPLPNPG